MSPSAVSGSTGCLKTKLLLEPAQRPRWTTREQAERLLAELGKNALHVAAIVRLRLATAMPQMYSGQTPHSRLRVEIDSVTRRAP